MIIVPIFEKDVSGYYNSAAVIDADGSLLPTYRRLHIPHDPHFYGGAISIQERRYGSTTPAMPDLPHSSALTSGFLRPPALPHWTEPR